MLKKLSVKILVLIGMVALYCFSFLSAFAVKAESYDETQAGVTIHKNYDIATASEGAYAPLLLNKNGDLSDYYANYYAGGAVNFHSGYMYEAEANGITSTVRILEEYSGTFSIIGQGFYDAYGVENGVFVADYGRLTFQFTNVENDKQYYKFSFTQTASHYLELNVYYYDRAVNAQTHLHKATKKISMSFTEKSAYVNNKNLPFRFEYVMATQTLNMRDENVSQGATHDLEALTGASLPVFERYSVDMLFENKSQRNTAKFIVYELCGQSLAGASLVDTSAPVMLSITASTAEKRISAKAYDLVDGVIQSGFSFIVRDPEGVDVTDTQDSARFAPDGFGDYTITAYVSDKSGKQSALKTVTVTVEPDTTKPQISVNGQYRRAYLKGENVTLFDCTATDESGIKESGFTVVKDGQAIQTTDGVLALEGLGVYEIAYYGVDNYDNRQEVRIELRVVEISVAKSVSLEASNEAQSIPQISVPSGWYYQCEMYLKSDAEKENAIRIQNGVYTFNGVQTYVLVYSVIPEFETQVKFVYQTEVVVTDTQKPTITLLGKYAEAYELGDILTIVQAEITDNTDSIMQSVTVLYAEQALETRADGTFLLDKTGAYEVVYTAKDASGNESSLRVQLRVEQKPSTATEPKENNTIALVIGASVLVLGVGVAIAFAVSKNKKR